MVPLLPPTGLSASDGDPSNLVRLSWQASFIAAALAVAYVYRDAQDTKIGSITDEAANTNNPGNPDERMYDDETVPDFEMHTYWLKAVNEFATSDFSLPDLGNTAIGPVAILTIPPGQENGTTPHQVDFNASFSNDPDGGQIAKFEWDWEGDGNFTFDSGTDATVMHVYRTAGSFNPTVRVTDDEGVSAEASVVVDVNSPPVADLQANPTSGNQPLMVQFDASGSSDSNGEIVKYEFDWDEGAGWIDFNTVPTSQHEYAEIGTYTARVRVTDDDDAMNTATVQVEVTGDNPWSMFGHDRKHTRRSQFNGPQTNNVKWSFDTGDRVYSSPAIGEDGIIYVGSEDTHKVFAINLDGTKKWEYSTGGTVYSSPAIGSDGTIYIGSNDRYLYALNPDGSLKWSFFTSNGGGRRNI